jgi:hypothetical protein
MLYAIDLPLARSILEMVAAKYVYVYIYVHISPTVNLLIQS